MTVGAQTEQGFERRWRRFVTATRSLRPTAADRQVQPVVSKRTESCRPKRQAVVVFATPARFVTAIAGPGIDAVLRYWYTKRPRRVAAPGGAPRWGMGTDSGSLWSPALDAGHGQSARISWIRGRKDRTLAFVSGSRAVACGCPVPSATADARDRAIPKRSRVATHSIRTHLDHATTRREGRCRVLYRM